MDFYEDEGEDLDDRDRLDRGDSRSRIEKMAAMAADIKPVDTSKGRSTEEMQLMKNNEEGLFYTPFDQKLQVILWGNK